jgi:4'-phosphopantetheinyl transferase
VGIDVESFRSYKDSLVHYTMSDEEIRYIEASERPEVAFIRLWTMKEATLKLIGTGISDDLKTAINHQQYRYTTVERAQYIYTVCVKKVP